MAIHTVNVKFDSGSNTLVILDPNPPIELKAGDQVVWQFIDIPAKFAPEVDFQSPDQPFGPFQGVHTKIESHQQAVLIGEGNVGGDPRSYECRPEIGKWVTGELESVYRSVTTTTIYKTEGASVPPKEIHVQVSTDKVTVNPETLEIYEGDVVIWYFRFDEPASAPSYRPVVYFTAMKPVGNGVTVTPTGPFEDLAFAVFQEGPFQYRAIGSGNNQVFGEYYYWVGAEAAEETGLPSLRTVVDPVIDNSGPPAAPIAVTEVRASAAA